MKMYQQATESIKQKSKLEKKPIFYGIYKDNEEKSRIRIRTKMSRIRNTALQM